MNNNEQSGTTNVEPNVKKIEVMVCPMQFDIDDKEQIKDAKGEPEIPIYDITIENVEYIIDEICEDWIEIRLLDNVQEKNVKQDNDTERGA